MSFRIYLTIFKLRKLLQEKVFKHSSDNCEINKQDEFRQTSNSDVSIASSFSLGLQPTTSSRIKTSAAPIISRRRKTRTRTPFSDKMNCRISSVALTTARMSNDFHPRGFEEFCSELGGSPLDLEACSDIAAI
jgi:hypothetical protein